MRESAYKPGSVLPASW